MHFLHCHVSTDVRSARSLFFEVFWPSNAFSSVFEVHGAEVSVRELIILGIFAGDLTHSGFVVADIIVLIEKGRRVCFHKPYPLRTPCTPRISGFSQQTHTVHRLSTHRAEPVALLESWSRKDIVRFGRLAPVLLGGNLDRSLSRQGLLAKQESPFQNASEIFHQPRLLLAR